MCDNKYNLRLDNFVSEMLDEKKSRAEDFYDRSVLYDRGSLNDRKRDYLRGVYESDVRYMGRNLIEERELVRSLPMTKDVVNEGEIARFRQHLKNRIDHMDDKLRHWKDKQKELFNEAFQYFNKNIFPNNRAADINLTTFQKDMDKHH